MSIVSRLTLFQKVLLSCFPLVSGVAVVTWYVYTSSQSGNDDLQLSVQMVDTVNQAELNMVKMSENMRGFLLNPSDLSELEKKEKADEGYSQMAEKLTQLTVHFKDIPDLNKKMVVYDESVLHHKEEEVVEKAKVRPSEALVIYAEKYAPARAVQDKSFAELKALVTRHAEEIAAAYATDKVKNANQTITILLGSVAIGMFMLLWVLRDINSKLIRASAAVTDATQRLHSESIALSSASQNLASASAEEASSVEEISGTLEHIAHKVSTNLEDSKKSLNLTQAVRGMVETSSQSMRELQTAVDKIAEGTHRVEKLSRLIEQIGDKTELIDEIVFQTRLLSFNASVEAERAGEHGRGFAVVAQEVGNLAQMSGKSAAEITKIVKESVHEAQEVTKINKDLVLEGVALCKTTAKQLQSIDEASLAILNGAKQIAQSSEDQSNGLKEINHGLQLVSQSAQTNASLAEQCSKGSQQLNGQSQDLSSVVNDIRQIVYGRIDQHQMNSQAMESARSFDDISSLAS